MVADHRSEQKANRGAVKRILVRRHGTLSYGNFCLCASKTPELDICALDDCRQFSISDETKVLLRGPTGHIDAKLSDSSFA